MACSMVIDPTIFDASHAIGMDLSRSTRVALASLTRDVGAYHSASEVSRLMMIAKRKLRITMWSKPISWGARTIAQLMEALLSETGGRRMRAAIDLGNCGSALIYERDERAGDVCQALGAALSAEAERGLRWPMLRALEKVAEIAMASGANLMPSTSPLHSMYSGASVYISPLYTALMPV